MKRWIIYTSIFIGLLLLTTAIETRDYFNFDQENFDRRIQECTTRECLSQLNDTAFARYFTMIRENGSTEKIILIEEYPDQTLIR